MLNRVNRKYFFAYYYYRLGVRNRIINMVKYIPLLIFLISSLLPAQESLADSSKAATVISAEMLDSLPVYKIVDTRAIVFSVENNCLPEKMIIEGEIIEASPCESNHLLHESCNGTISVKLKEKVENYSYNRVYVVIPELSGKKEDYVGKHIQASITKLYKEYADYSSHAMVIINTIDSGGIPFYWTADLGVR